MLKQAFLKTNCRLIDVTEYVLCTINPKKDKHFLESVLLQGQIVVVSR